MPLIAVNIRPHLVSFLYKELNGQIQADVEGKKVKLANVSRSSLLGQMVQTFEALASETTKKSSSYSIFLRITNDGVKEGAFHSKSDRKYKVLELLPGHVVMINNLLESMFRLSAVEFIKGYAKGSESLNAINKAIHIFMLDHDLYETELDPESLRRMYYNAIKKKHSLARFQNQTSTRSLYYHSA